MAKSSEADRQDANMTIILGVRRAEGKGGRYVKVVPSPDTEIDFMRFNQKQRDKLHEFLTEFEALGLEPGD